MVRLRNKWAYLLLAISLIGFTVGAILYNKPHKNIVKAKVAYSLTSADLFNQFKEDDGQALKKYRGKVLEVNGSIQTIELDAAHATIILANEGDFYGVNCSFNAKQLVGLDKLVVGELVTIKGECQGYIDDVILSNCTLLKK
jgi:hypothetical protein